MGKLQELPEKIRAAFGLKQGRGYTRAYAEFLLSEASPGLARSRMMARVVSVSQPSTGSKSFVVRPPSRWRGFKAGMYIPVTVEVNGARHCRTYTLSSTPEDYRKTGTVTFTARRLTEGKVSAWLHDEIDVGQWLQVDHAAGNFTLAEVRDSAPLLMLAAGIGITPLYSMICDAAKRQPGRDMVLLYYCQRDSEAPFLEELRALSQQLPGFTFSPIFTQDAPVTLNHGRIRQAQLDALCPDFSRRDVLMCGPAGFMNTARQILLDGGLDEQQLHAESFGLRSGSSSAPLGPAEVVFTRSGTRHTVTEAGTLLELAERAGLKPKHGCRAGICHQCKTTKLSGRVTDLLSGAVTGPDRSEIQLCVSAPYGKVELDL